MKTALVIIDLQEGSFTPRTARHDTAGLVVGSIAWPMACARRAER
jgi:nicotinamidase-related amidase